MDTDIQPPEKSIYFPQNAVYLIIFSGGKRGGAGGSINIHYVIAQQVLKFKYSTKKTPDDIILT